MHFPESRDYIGSMHLVHNVRGPEQVAQGSLHY